MRAVAYYLNNGSISEDDFRAHLAEALGTPGTVTIVPVPLSHFYYDGLMVEIDFVFAERSLGEPVLTGAALPTIRRRGCVRTTSSICRRWSQKT